MLMGSLLGNLGAVTGSPLVKAATRYWWVSLPLGYIAYAAYQKRKAKGGEMDWHGLVGDVTPAITIALSLVTLDLMLRGQATPVSGLGGVAKAPRPQPPQPQAVPVNPRPPSASTPPRVIDAEFTPVTQPTDEVTHG